MNLRLKIQEDIKQALKTMAKQKLEFLRFLNAQIKDKEIEQGRKELTDEGIIKLINNQVKKLNESLVFFEKQERKELTEKTKKEINFLKTYLPEQLSDKDLEREIDKIIKDNPNPPHPGALIGIAVRQMAGKADNKRISQIIMKVVKKS